MDLNRANGDPPPALCLGGNRKQACRFQGLGDGAIDHGSVGGADPLAGRSCLAPRKQSDAQTPLYLVSRDETVPTLGLGAALPGPQSIRASGTGTSNVSGPFGSNQPLERQSSTDRSVPH
jgi:hypothetical protein